MNEPTLNSAIPGAILHKLGLVRRRKMLVQVASAAVAALAVLLAAMGVAMLIDWLSTLYDSRWRFVLTLAALSAAGLTTAGWLVLAWRRGLRWDRVAGDVDRQFPLLEERWTTITQLRPEDASNPELVHPAMLRRVATEAVRWEPHVEPDQVVSLSPLSRTMIALTAITAVLALAVVLDTRQALVLMRRFWLPGSSISATELVNVPGHIIIGRGEPLALAAAVKGTPVERAVLFLRDDEDAERTIALVAHGREPIEFSHRLRSVEEPFAYRFRAGDGQTEWYNVDVADRPEIDKLEMKVTPPSYTGRPEKSFDKLPPRLAAIERSELELALRPSMPVERVELQMGKDHSIRLTADTDGWYRWKTTLKDAFTLAPILTESHGLTNRRVPKCQFSVYPDRPPAVKVLTPDDQMEVRPDDTVQITFSAQDDVGIGSAELLIYDEAALEAGDEPVPIATIPIPLAEQAGNRSIQKSVDLDLGKLGFEDGSELSYEIRVREDRGGSPQEQVATSPQTASPSADQLASSSPLRPATSRNNLGAPNQSASGQQSSTPQQGSQSARSNESASPDTQAQAGKQSPSSGSQQPEASAESPPRVASRDPSRMDAPPLTDAARAPTDSSPRIASRATTPSQSPSQSPQNSANPSNQERATASSTPSKPGASQQANAPSQRPNQPAGGNGSDENKMAGNQPNDPARNAAAPKNNRPTASQTAQEPGPPRTATSDRRALSSRPQSASQPAESMANQSESQKAGSNPANSQMANNSQSPQSNNNNSKSGQPADKNQPANSQQQQSPSSSQTASKGGKSSPSSPSDPPPGDAMTKRSLDVPQESSSKRMRLKVDEWAGSFEGQQRSKVEMAIAPELDALDQALAKAERTARGVIDDLGAGGEWQGRHDRDVSTAEKSTVEGQQVITRLQERSKDTPYAFIGLQVADIGLAHVNPARSGLWKALQSEGGDRIGSVRDAAQHLARAREMVAELKGQFERAKKEFQLAESVERVKKMYRVYLENSQALLRTQDSDPKRFNRKIVEFELDEEYLARLREVMEMRRDLQAELARILADDPRLLRRFMDSLKNRAHSLREDLSELVAGQEDLNREVRAWTLVEEADRPRIAKILKMRQAQDASKIATAAGELQSRYQAWLPLNRESKDADLAAASKKIQQVATTASELYACCQGYITNAQRPAIAAAPAGSDAASGDAAADAAAKPQAAADDMAPMLAKGQQLYSELSGLEVSLRQLAAREEGAEAAGFAANRLVETRRLIADTSAWVRQMRAHESGNYPRAAEVDQYRLAMKTDELAGKLGAIEQSLAALMQRADGSLPQPIAEKARQFLTTLDKQASPNQLAGVYALHSNQLPRAVERQRSAGDALTRAEKQYDELIRMAIQELDKLPVQDPIAQLLDDPTLDELLAELEQESPIQELLGIPLRPSNLQIVDDWLNRGGDNALAAGGGRMMMNQFRQEQQRTQRRLDQAYRRAIARALKEAKPKQPIVIPKPVTLSDWNQLVSKLGDDLRQGRDKAPPEQYRRAIEQYFAQISNVVADQEKRED